MFLSFCATRDAEAIERYRLGVLEALDERRRERNVVAVRPP